MKAKERYDALSPHREQFLQRARHNAMLTIPSLMPLMGHDGKAHLIEPYQALGSAGVTGMSSRMTLALLPAGRPHLRLELPADKLMELDGEVSPELNQQLGKGEKLIQTKVEKANWRSDTLSSVMQLIIAGSVVEEMLDDDTIRIHRLDNFVVRRDFRGRVIEAVLREFWDKNALPEGVSKPEAATSARSDTHVDDVEIYTYIQLMKAKDGDDEFYRVNKEIGAGTNISTEDFTPKKLRYLFLRWATTPGEDYGRSKVEELVADLRSLDSLSKQSLEQGAMAAKNFIMIRPGATSNGLKNRISRSDNGDVILGDPESVDLKQFANQAGYQITSDQIEKLEARISKAFLLLGATQRNAERVTATEIERDIQELESTLGGVFSALSLDMLERRTQILIDDMQDRDEFPKHESGDLQVTILTGLEALSRERDVARAQQAAQIAQLFGEEAIKRLKLGVILDKAMTGIGFPDAIKSEDEVLARDKQLQQQALLEKAAGPVVQAAAKGEQQ